MVNQYCEEYSRDYATDYQTFHLTKGKLYTH